MVHFVLRILRKLNRQVLSSDKGQLLRALGLLVIIILICTFGFHWAESDRFLLENKKELAFFDCLWWTLTTITTVGYGDFFPTTFYGRIFGYIAFFGTGLLAWALGETVSLVLSHRSRRLRGLLMLDFEKHVLICHFPGLEKIREVIGEIRADRKFQKEPIVLVNNVLEENPFPDDNIFFVKGSPNNKEILLNAAVDKASRVIVLSQDETQVESDFQSLGVVLIVEKNFPWVRTVVECVAKENRHLFFDAGSDEVINLSSLAAGLLSQAMKEGGIPEVITYLVSNRSNNRIFSLIVQQEEISVSGVMEKYFGKCHAIFLGFKSESRMQINPGDEEILKKGDIIFYIHDRRIAV
ncbi:ion channel [Candidatus Riflebacteria bacterium]